ncbi:hypothetical protein B0T26DRAFT_680102 [Lasiosphaeria miniovina]|uniref:Uncharacterized protein n=1 Tax=Lasiosphaeria miniovina TaxID=1954250 RepID=A0AA39ZZ97_9PEZI|nr:uncharacterized protein B0T26DRAFT_680102 [Lasiosphaeria miniovina]KAK0706412.1 hypothetical protein B0T26DRAFT_680102 [Lasiosphaeria miniovina]
MEDELTESLIFWTLGLPTATSFRMFLSAAASLDATVVHSYALVTITLIPYFASRGWYMDGRGMLGELLRPLTRGTGDRLERAVMFARVWLAVAWVNLAVARFMVDLRLVLVASKVSCVLFIL